MSGNTFRLGYVAREVFVPFHARRTRWAAIVAHRRAGKTVACVMDLIDAALNFKKHANGRFAYIAPYYAQAKDVAWNYVKQFCSVIPGVQFHESELKVSLPNGSTIRLYGADNYDRMRGLYFDGVVLDEIADMDPRAWTEVIRPTLSDRKGWAVFIGTPKGPNAFRDLIYGDENSLGALKDPAWFCAILKASETGLIDAAELETLKASMSIDQYMQEFECSFEAAIKGAYYADQLRVMQMEGRITRVPYTKFAPVFTSWDLGIRDQAAIWFGQRVGSEVRWIDYFESHSVGLDVYAQYLREWAAERRAVYSTHYFPHDVEVRELSTGKSRRQTLYELGFENIETVPQHNVLDGINASRRILEVSWIDEEACKKGIRCLQMYRSDMDEKTGAFKPKPVHDQYSHGADAFRQYAAVHDFASVEQATVFDKYKRNAGRQSASTSWAAE